MGKKKYTVYPGSYIFLPIFLRLEVFIIKNVWDKEYNTSWLEEVKFLKDHGIRYSFVKEHDGISTYKYTKTLELFQTLALFYETIYYRNINQSKKEELS